MSTFELEVPVRYPEDNVVDGKEDVDAQLPLLKNGMFKAKIHIPEGKVLNWPQGTVATPEY